MSRNKRAYESYSVGIICALPLEKTAVRAAFDEEHDRLPNRTDDENEYSFGRIGRHNVVVACLPAGMIGKVTAATVAKDMKRSFPVKVGLLVGIGGGAPSRKADIRLGDVVVSQPRGDFGGVVQWDFGKMEPGGFRRTAMLNKPPRQLLNALATLQDIHEWPGTSKVDDHLEKIGERLGRPFHHQGIQNDVLFEAGYDHEGGDDGCEACNSDKVLIRKPRSLAPTIFYGNIASGDEVMRAGLERDRIATSLAALCFDMEAAGLEDNFPCLVIRGICDYADSHKNKMWQRYAAATAAAYMKELLGVIDVRGVEELEAIGPPTERIGARLPSRLTEWPNTLPTRRMSSSRWNEGIEREIDDLIQKAENTLDAGRATEATWHLGRVDGLLQQLAPLSQPNVSRFVTTSLTMAFCAFQKANVHRDDESKSREYLDIAQHYITKAFESQTDSAFDQHCAQVLALVHEIHTMNLLKHGNLDTNAKNNLRGRLRYADRKYNEFTLRKEQGIRQRYQAWIAYELERLQ